MKPNRLQVATHLFHTDLKHLKKTSLNSPSNYTAGPCVVAPGCCGIFQSRVTRQNPSHSLLGVFRGHLGQTAQYSCATKKQQQTFSLILWRKAARLERSKQTQECPEDHAVEGTCHLVRPHSKQMW